MPLRRWSQILLLAVCCLLLSVIASTATAEISASDRTLVDQVAARLLAVTAPPATLQWPPTVEIKDDSSINAGAMVVKTDDAEKPAARVTVLKGMLTDVIEGEPDRLAFVVGHELAHIVLGHVMPSSGREKTPFVLAAFSREQEIAADKKGMELVLAAGYSYRRALKGIQRMMDLGLEYSSFEGLGVDHPGWKDRLVLLDAEQASLWGAMSAFDNGTVFLLVEQYAAAERCFRVVTREFPSCHEAWANLGYALLMQYCDALETDDVRRFGIGHIVCGGFYHRPRSLEARVRGIDEELWWNAVGALREALRLEPELTLAQANLGVAYLVRPAGKDVGQATRYLQAAADAAGTDPMLDPVARAAVLVNAGVADLAGGNAVLCAQRLDRAAQESQRRFAGQGRRLPATNAVSAALLYNRGLLLADSGSAPERQRAAEMLAQYLGAASPSSSWWPLAYARYAEVCQERGITPKSEQQLRGHGPRPLRMVTSVAIGRDGVITLTDSLQDVQARLGAAEAVPVAAGSNLKRLPYPRYGIDLLASEQVLAICLVDSSAPGIALRGAGLGGETITLRVGMTQLELEQGLADEDYDFRQLTDPDVSYRFYRNLGLAVRLQKGIVKELVIVQIPERSMPGSD